MAKDKSSTEATVEEPPVETAKVQMLMYVGPTMLQPILLVHRNVYKGLPVLLGQQDKDLRSALKACFVPLNEAAGVLRELEGTKSAGAATENYKNAERVIRSRK